MFFIKPNGCLSKSVNQFSLFVSFTNVVSIRHFNSVSLLVSICFKIQSKIGTPGPIQGAKLAGISNPTVLRRTL